MSVSPVSSGLVRRLLTYSLAFSAAIVVLGAIVLLSASPAEAAAYSLTNTSPPINWTDTTKWGCAPGPCTYPGASTGDTATLGFASSYIVNVDAAIPNAVGVNLTCAGCSINIPAAGSIILNAGTFPGGTALDVSGGTLAVSASSTIAFSGTAHVNFLSGTITNNGTLDFAQTSAFEWTSGTLTGPSPALTHFQIGSGSQFKLLGAGTKTLDNHLVAIGSDALAGGGAFYSAGTFTMVNGASLSVNAGSQFQMGDVAIVDGGGVGNVIGMGGALKRTFGAPGGTSTVGVGMTVSGSVSITQPGTVSFTANGNHTGQFDTTNGTIALDGASNAFNASSTIIGSGTFAVRSGATMHLPAGPVSVTSPFTLGGGVVNGLGDLNLNALTWTGGNFSTVGNITWSSATINGSVSAMAVTAGVVNANGPTSYTASANGLTISAGTLNNSGLFTYAPAAAAGEIVVNATFANVAGGTLALSNSRPINGSGTINNTNGSIDKSVAGLSEIFPVLNNAAPSFVRANLSGAVIRLRSGGTHAGTFDVQAGAEIDFNGGTHGVAGPMTGLGTFRFSGAVVNVNAPQTLNNAIITGGTVAGSGNLTIPSLTWSGGTLQGPATVTATNTTMNVTGAASLTRSFSSTGTFTYTPTGGTLTIGTGGVLDNNGTFTATADGTLVRSGTGRINNFGTFQKSGGAGALNVNPLFDNLPPGTLRVSSGKIVLGAAGNTSAGIIDLPGLVELEIPGSADLTITAGSVAGTGGIRVFGGTLTVNAPVTIPRLTMVGFPTVNGSGALTVTTLDWINGTMSGTGTTTVTGTTNASTGNYTLSRSFNNQGTFNFTGASSTFGMTAGVIFNNSGTMNLTAINATFGAGGGTLNNIGPSGLIVVAAGGSFPFTLNPAVLNNQSGAIFRSSTGALYLSAPTTTSAGEINITGGRLDFYGAVALNPGATVTGNGQFNIYGGTVSANTSLTIPNLVISSGTLTGVTPQDITANQLTWGSGTISGSGSINLVGPGISSFQFSLPATLDTRRIDLNSVLIDYWANNGLTFANGAAINISSSGTYSADAALNKAFSGSGSIHNGGAFQVSGPATITVPAGISFTNSTGGTGLQILGGSTLALQGVFTNSGGAIFVDAGSTLSSVNAIVLGGGTLSGFGTVAANVTNNGNVNPGASPGQLTISGNYTQTSAGTLNIELAGNTLANYDQLAVTGSVMLDGTLNVDTTLYPPVNGDSFTVLTFASRPGSTDFAVKNGLNPTTGVPLTDVYTPTALNLVAPGAAASADLSITMTDAPDPVLPGGAVTYTITVHNAGPDPAGPITVDDLLPGGSTFVSATGPGWTCTPGPGNVSCSGFGASALAPSTTSNPITIVVNAPATPGTMTNIAQVQSPVPDPVSANNTIQVTTSVANPPPPSADMRITKTGLGVLSPGTVSFDITVRNGGPSNALNVMVNDPTPAGMTFVSNTGDCTTPFPCALGTLAPNAQRSITTTFAFPAGTSSVTNTATVSTTTTDPFSSNNSATDTVVINRCPVDNPIQITPQENATDAPLEGTINWTGVGGDLYEVYFGASGGGCNTLLTTTTATSVRYPTLVAGQEYESRIVATGAGCASLSSRCIKWRAGGCVLQAPTPIDPPSPSTGRSSPVTFRWTDVGADLYTLFVGVNGATPTEVGSTTATSFVADVPTGAVVWYVIASKAGCASARSADGQFDSCNPPERPHAGVEGAPISGVVYSVVWDATPGSVRYEVDQADNAQFLGATTQSTTNLEVSFTHQTVGEPLVFFYRVRAFGTCTNVASANSRTVRVVILPPAPTTDVNVPVGTLTKVKHSIFIPGEPDGAFNFIATTDQPWAVVTPPAGVLQQAPGGVTLEVEFDPSTLPNGTFTTTVILNLLPIGSGKVGTHAVTSKSQPVSINLVTPVKPGDVSAPTADTLIIPSVGHLAGINSLWRSDIRVLNTASQRARYQLDFITSGATDVKQTIIEVDTNTTTALDDIVHNWFGFGEVGDSANGILQIRPLNTSGPGPNANAISSSLTTAASSRTYSTSASGTLGQFIPAVQFERFIGKAASGAAASILSLQQIAQSANYRTNIGVVEAAGKPVSVLLSVFNSAGTRLAEVPLDLKAGEQKQLNGFLATQGLTLDDARVEVRVTDGDGKVTAYASMIDNLSIDPLLVSAVKVGETTAQRYALPGVADLNSGTASWRTDMRIFNGGSTAQTATLTFHPLNNASAPLSASVTVTPGEVRVLDSVLQSLFGARDIGGIIHVVTAGDSQLTVTGRTYNRTSNGTFGQFIPAVTTADAADRTSRALHILQVEDSVRYRTNVGIAEITGNSAVVEVTVNLPDSKVTPKVQIPLAANEFRQFAVIKELGLQNVYNARVTVKVISGNGAVTAYGSVIDMLTTDPTYVPAQ